MPSFSSTLYHCVTLFYNSHSSCFIDHIRAFPLFNDHAEVVGLCPDGQTGLLNDIRTTVILREVLALPGVTYEVGPQC